ncbi:hypothetical protein, partial [Bradyrhizobium canariense]|uniref:hypothetical protein n=1 Tax=Bradyrhizobium canariense TaxID=255045 RepID=UPI001A7E1789
FSTNAICASENFDAFMELSSSRQGIINGKFQFKLASFGGGTSPTARANSGLDKTRGQGHTNSTISTFPSTSPLQMAARRIADAIAPDLEFSR